MEPVQRISIRDEADVYAAAQRAKRLARQLHFDEIGQSRLGTVTLELARNALQYGGGGDLCLCFLDREGQAGLEVQVVDCGPGISDVEQALTDGFSTGGGLGSGLGAARRLSDEFEINSRPGGGTRVVARAWRSPENEQRGKR